MIELFLLHKVIIAAVNIINWQSHAYFVHKTTLIILISGRSRISQIGGGH